MSWLLDIVGTTASVFGLIFSWKAWGQAKAAKEAAIEAAEAARTQETVHEFAMLAADAKELLSAVQDGRKERAIAAANDLVHLLGIAIARRSSYLPAGSELDQQVKNLRLVSNSLASVGFPTESRDVSALIRRCEQIHAIVCEVSGAVERNKEEIAK